MLRENALFYHEWKTVKGRGEKAGGEGASRKKRVRHDRGMGAPGAKLFLLLENDSNNVGVGFALQRLRPRQTGMTVDELKPLLSLGLKLSCTLDDFEHAHVLICDSR